MKPVKIPLDQLTADPQNARVHPERGRTLRLCDIERRDECA